LLSLQAEASGFLKVDADLAKRLGLPGMTEAQCQVASALWLTHPVVPTEAALIALGIPIVQKSRKVEAIATCPPGARMRKVLRGGQVTYAPVDIYSLRPASMELVTMRE
jgi:hypothetical protein